MAQPVYPTVKQIVETRTTLLAIANHDAAVLTRGSAYFIRNLRKGQVWPGLHLECDRIVASQRPSSRVLEWLIHDWHFLGITGQIWMPVFAAGLLLYVVVLLIVRRCNGPRTR